MKKEPEFGNSVPFLHLSSVELRRNPLSAASNSPLDCLSLKTGERG